MITAALRTGLPLSSFRMRKFRTAVGSSSLSRCAAATPSSAKSKSRQARVRVFISLFIPIPILTLVLGHSSEWGGGKEEAEAQVESRFSGGPTFVPCASHRGKLHEITGDTGGVVAGHASLFQVISQNRDHAQGFDGV